MLFEPARNYQFTLQPPRNQRTALNEAILEDQLLTASEKFMYLCRNLYGETYDLFWKHSYELTSAFDEMKDLLFENSLKHNKISILIYYKSDNVKATHEELVNCFVKDILGVFYDNLIYEKAYIEGVILNTTILDQLKDEFLRLMTSHLFQLNAIEEIILSDRSEDELIDTMKRTKIAGSPIVAALKFTEACYQTDICQF